MTDFLGVLEGKAYDTNFGNKFWGSRVRLPHAYVCERAKIVTPLAQPLLGNVSDHRFFGINSVLPTI